MSQTISKKLDIPAEWVFIYFTAKNCEIKDFGDQSRNHQMYSPSENETSKIFIMEKSLKCEICQRNIKIMIRNLCQHIFCYGCLKNYIYTFYSNR